MLFDGVEGRSSAGVDVEGESEPLGDPSGPAGGVSLAGGELLPLGEEEGEPSAVPAPTPEPSLGELGETVPGDDPEGGECPS